MHVIVIIISIFDTSEYKKSDVVVTVIGKFDVTFPYIHPQVNITVKTKWRLAVLWKSRIKK